MSDLKASCLKAVLSHTDLAKAFRNSAFWLWSNNSGSLENFSHMLGFQAT